MRVRDIIFEDDDTDTNGKAVDISINNLANILETLRNRADDMHQIPKIRVDSLINMMRNQPGSEMFNVDSLITAFKDNEVIKNLVKNIKPDPAGVKYLYLKSMSNDEDYSLDNIEANDQAVDPETTIDQMAKRALSKRG